MPRTLAQRCWTDAVKSCIDASDSAGTCCDASLCNVAIRILVVGWRETRLEGGTSHEWAGVATCLENADLGSGVIGSKAEVTWYYETGG